MGLYRDYICVCINICVGQVMQGLCKGCTGLRDIISTMKNPVDKKMNGNWVYNYQYSGPGFLVL